MGIEVQPPYGVTEKKREKGTRRRRQRKRTLEGELAQGGGKKGHGSDYKGVLVGDRGVTGGKEET